MAKARLTNRNMSMTQGALHPEITLELQGIEGVNQAIAKMGKDAKRLIKKISRKNMKPMLNTLRSLTPVKTGTLRREWVLRGGKGDAYATSTIITRRKRGDAYYAHMIEDGFKPRGGETRVPGKHMLADTYRAKYSSTASAVSNDLINELVRTYEIG